MSLNKLKLLNKNRFGLSYAKSRGLGARMLTYYVQKGLLIKLGHDLYAFPDKIGFDYESIVKEKILQVPHAVVGCESALMIYGLSEEAPSTITLFVSEKNVPKRKLDDVTLYTLKEHLVGDGVAKVKGLPVTTLERTIVDLLRKRNNIRLCLDVIKEAQQKKMKVSLTEIERLGNVFRAKAKVKNLLGAL